MKEQVDSQEPLSHTWWSKKKKQQKFLKVSKPTPAVVTSTIHTLRRLLYHLNYNKCFDGFIGTLQLQTHAQGRQQDSCG